MLGCLLVAGAGAWVAGSRALAPRGADEPAAQHDVGGVIKHVQAGGRVAIVDHEVRWRTIVESRQAEELARRKGVRPVESVEDMAQDS